MYRTEGWEPLSLNGAKYRTLRDLIRACLLYLRLNSIFYRFALTLLRTYVKLHSERNCDEATPPDN
jgi:hypothetical protein